MIKAKERVITFYTERASFVTERASRQCNESGVKCPDQECRASPGGFSFAGATSVSRKSTSLTATAISALLCLRPGARRIDGAQVIVLCDMLKVLIFGSSCDRLTRTMIILKTMETIGDNCQQLKRSVSV